MELSGLKQPQLCVLLSSTKPHASSVKHRPRLQNHSYFSWKTVVLLHFKMLLHGNDIKNRSQMKGHSDSVKEYSMKTVKCSLHEISPLWGIEFSFLDFGNTHTKLGLQCFSTEEHPPHPPTPLHLCNHCSAAYLSSSVRLHGNSGSSGFNQNLSSFCYVINNLILNCSCHHFSPYFFKLLSTPLSWTGFFLIWHLPDLYLYFCVVWGKWTHEGDVYSERKGDKWSNISQSVSSCRYEQ